MASSTGYALVSGKFFANSSTIQFAAGAPRAGFLTGRVYIFTLAEPSSAIAGANNMTIIVELRGENATDEDMAYGSYFGSALAAADVNGDGLDDILVSAPLFSFGQDVDQKEGNKQRKFGSAEGEEGCVFVYYSNGVGLQYCQESVLKLVPVDIRHSLIAFCFDL